MKPKKFKIKRSFVENITTIHGTHHLSARNPRWRNIFWIAVLIGNAIFTIYLVIVVKERYESNQIYTSVDATCKVKDVAFPSVNICNENQVSLEQSKNIFRILKFYGRRSEEIEAYFAALPLLQNFGYKSVGVGPFQEITDILKRHYFTVDTIMEEVLQKCDNLLVYCEFNRKIKKCDGLFKVIKTLKGHCCAFNYAALNDATEDPELESDQDFEYYDDRKVGKIISTGESGRSSGLTVILDIEPNDYPTWARFRSYGATIIINDPNDFPETTVNFKYIHMGESVDMKIDPMIFIGDSSIRKVDVDKRNCWFHDETILNHTDRYSYETCNTECRMKEYDQICGCVPYKYPREKSMRICELSDLPCLHNLTVTGSKTPCYCYPECTDKKYKVTSDTMPFLVKDFPKDVTANLNISQMSSLKVFYGQSNCNCYKKILLIDYDKLIATYGGVFSLNVGVSILSTVELIYLLLSHVFTIIWNAVSSLRYKFRANKLNSSK